jgi:hypothetical protein
MYCLKVPLLKAFAHIIFNRAEEGSHERAHSGVILILREQHKA